MTRQVRLRSLAKVNLDLRVLHKRADGFHELRTVFQTISLADTISIEYEPARRTVLELEDPLVIPDNLILRAARVTLGALKVHARVRFRLQKRIPMGGGLGGGSSNAAAVLLALPVLAGRQIPFDRLLELGAELGSDVPFFFSGAPLALAWGRGERMIRLPPLPPSPALLVTPPVPIPTPEAYAWVDAAGATSARRGALAPDLDAGSRWGDIGRMAGNDFESPVFSRHGNIRAAFEALVATRPLVCRMSGSGSTLFAIYRSSRDREDAAMMLSRKHGLVARVETAGQSAPGLTSESG